MFDVEKLLPAPTLFVKAASEYQVRLEPVAVKGGITEPSQATSSIEE